MPTAGCTDNIGQPCRLSGKTDRHRHRAAIDPKADIVGAENPRCSDLLAESRSSNDQRQSARPDREWLEKCQQGGPRIGSSSEGRHLKLKLVRRIKAGHMLLATAARLAKAGEKRKNSCWFGVHSENRLCLFSLLELLSSPSQCLLRLFLVQLLYPCSQSCCVAQKA